MGKLRTGVLITSGVLGLILAPGAWAATGADRTSGDVWLDNARTSTDPGHEMDPHLACQDIALWGSGLAESSGAYSLEGFSPSGSQELDYQGTWSYPASGSRVIATINVSELIAQAEANGDAPAAQGFHFKLDLAQDPQKHKTFWVDCPAGGINGGGTNSGGTNSGGTNTGSFTPPGVTTDSNEGVVTSIGAVTARRHRGPALHKRHRLIHPARHRAIRGRHMGAVRVTTPPFTG